MTIPSDPWTSRLGGPTVLAETAGLRLERTGSLVHLVLDRTDKANALHQDMWDAIPGYLRIAASVKGARTVVVRSAAARIFSAGADVAEYRANAHDPAWAEANHRRVTTATDAIHSCPLVTVAAISGPCAGGAVGIISACDFRLADPTAVFAIPPTRLGLVYPQADTARLVDAVGPAAARYLLLTAARVDADWALRVGLVTELVAAGTLPVRLDEIADAVAGGAPVSVRGMKRTIDLALTGQRTECDETRALLAEALNHPDHEEGTAAFLERRPPVFRS